MVLIFSRSLLLLLSLKYKKIAKIFVYYQLLILIVIVIGLPKDAGDLRHTNLEMELILTFTMDYFSFYPTLICMTVV